jgi:hypothetical protein
MQVGIKTTSWLSILFKKDMHKINIIRKRYYILL